MKVLHAVLSRDFYGSERYCIELAVAQARGGHDVRVLIEGGRSDCARAFGREVESARQAIADAQAAGHITLSLIPPWAPAFLHRPLARWELARFKPDIVHSHLNSAARRVGGSAQRLGIPHVATLHLGYEQREHATIDGLIALTAAQHATIPPQFGGDVAVVWSWLPARVEQTLAELNLPQVATLRGSWGADEGTFVFGSVGRLVPQKGMDCLVRAFRAAFPLADDRVRLVIVGDGEQRHEIEHLADGDPRIVLAGTQSDIAPYYRAFDMFVSAARFEPFGLSIIEAMAAGCPLIATRVDGPLAFVKHPSTLWAVPEDENDLAAKLRTGAARRRERVIHDMAALTLARATGEIEEFYRRIIQRGGRSRAGFGTR